MTVHTNPAPSIRDIIKERRELLAYFGNAFNAIPEAHPLHKRLFEVVRAYAEQSLTVEELMLASIISNKEAILWMKEEITMLKAQIDEIGEESTGT